MEEAFKRMSVCLYVFVFSGSVGRDISALNKSNSISLCHLSIECRGFFKPLPPSPDLMRSSFLSQLQNIGWIESSVRLASSEIL